MNFELGRSIWKSWLGNKKAVRMIARGLRPGDECGLITAFGGNAVRWPL